MSERHGDRQRKLSVWVTDAELQRVNDQARDMGITAASLVRSWISGETGLTPEALAESRELRLVMERVLVELHREGNNINQIARSVNSGEDPLSRRVVSLLEEIRNFMAEMEAQTRALWERVI